MSDYKVEFTTEGFNHDKDSLIETIGVSKDEESLFLDRLFKFFEKYNDITYVVEDILKGGMTEKEMRLCLLYALLHVRSIIDEDMDCDGNCDECEKDDEE